MPTETLAYNGAWKTFRVPEGVKSLTVDLRGGGSGVVVGGRVAGKLAVTPGQVLFVLVGGQGGARNAGRAGEGAVGYGGRGGDGAGGGLGGNGGGGASLIRMNSTSGTIKAVAGGAGGSSGDFGAGGRGGTAVGESGNPGPGAAEIGAATGGTGSQAGNGGTSASSATLNGADGTEGNLGRGGRGGQNTALHTVGGGGGGGGWRSGGGGVAGLVGIHPGGGGGGGSSYAGGLTGVQSDRSGTTGNGQVVISWNAPVGENQPPSTPTEVLVGGRPEADGLATRSTGSLTLSAVIADQNEKDRVRLFVQVSTTPSFTSFFTRQSEFVDRGKRASLQFTALARNTRYYLRIWSEDSRGRRSLTYNSTNFWTNRSPTAPELLTPQENLTVDTIDSVVFAWNHKDPDAGDQQSAFELRWRTSATLSKAAGPWVTRDRVTSFEGFTLDPGTLRSSTFYDWTVRTRDGRFSWSPWATPKSFYVAGTSASPTLLSPVDEVAVDAGEPIAFTWKFNDPDPGDAQVRADLRYRVVGAVDWITLVGTAETPGSFGRWDGVTIQPGYRYEWEVRTYDLLSGLPSDWSEPERFWAIASPGGGEDGGLPSTGVAQEALGVGHHRVFVYDQGGEVYRGEITGLVEVRWSRVRDDIALFNIKVGSWDAEGEQLLEHLRCWRHELVIYRNGERVAEGPITRIAYSDTVEIEARDVMAYVYRRIMRQGYSDTYRSINGEEFGLETVVDRAAQIVMNALAPHDPNLLPYLTPFRFPDDAQQARSVPDYSKSAWEEIDDLAATAGLDYTTVGRRIMLWDTHRAIGRLPEMRDDDFLSPLVVTEYGMSYASYFAVTNNNGVWGAASRDNRFTGPVEQLASAYGENVAAEAAVLTAAAREKLRVTLAQQASRNIASRWPLPLIARVPDNAGLNPEVNLGINQLIPGAWIPLRAERTIRPMAQWQKLDRVQVAQIGGKETIEVTMSPAPNQGQDPDADNAALEEG